jgi:hypothetical protein
MGPAVPEGHLEKIRVLQATESLPRASRVAPREGIDLCRQTGITVCESLSDALHDCRSTNEVLLASEVANEFHYNRCSRFGVKTV